MSRNERYRVSYGNGQCSDAMTLSQAERHLAECLADNGYARLARYEGNGDWSIRGRDGKWRI